MASIIDRIEQACVEVLQGSGDQTLEGSKLTLELRRKYQQLFRRVATPKGWLKQLVASSTCHLINEIDVLGKSEPCYRIAQGLPEQPAALMDIDSGMSIYDQLHEVARQILAESCSVGQCLDTIVLDTLVSQRQAEMAAQAKQMLGDREWLTKVLQGSPKISRVIAVGKTESEPSYTLREFNVGVLVNKTVNVAVDRASYTAAASPADMQPTEARLTFQPGPLGIGCRNGLIEDVLEGQAKAAGVDIGWQILTVDDVPYTEDGLEAKKRGGQPFMISFKVPRKASTDKMECGAAARNGSMKRPREGDEASMRKELLDGVASILKESARGLGFVEENRIAWKLKESYPEYVNEITAAQGNSSWQPWLRDVLASDGTIEKIEVQGLSEPCYKLRSVPPPPPPMTLGALLSGQTTAGSGGHGAGRW